MTGEILLNRDLTSTSPNETMIGTQTSGNPDSTVLTIRHYHAQTGPESLSVLMSTKDISTLITELANELKRRTD